MTATTMPLGGTATQAKRFQWKGLFGRLYRGETKMDFVRKRNRWFLLSSVVILAGAISLGVRGLNYSIEFVGGTSWEVPTATATVAQAKAVLTPLGLGGATIETLGGSGTRKLLVEAKIGNGQTAQALQAQESKVTSVLAGLAHISPNSVSTESVGPSWGGQITKKAIEALIVFFIVIAGYISIFFEWKMALAAIIAVIHDIAVTAGIYSLTGFAVTPDTVVAFLTILGYSLYDTIVVFDRVRDNARGLGATGRLSYTDVVNLSMNQTLARSINTSLVAILPILSVLVLGAEVLGALTLQYFGLALFIGLLSGAYSSIFIASPLLAVFKEREPRFRSIREKLESRGNAVQLLTASAVAAGAFSEDSPKVRSRRTGASKSKGAPPPRRIKPGSGAGAATRPAARGTLLDEREVEDDELTDVGPVEVGTLPIGMRTIDDGDDVADADVDGADVDETEDGLTGSGAGVKPGASSAKPAASRPPARPASGSAARSGGSGGTGGGAARSGGGGNGSRPGGGANRPAPRPRKKGKRR